MPQVYLFFTKDKNVVFLIVSFRQNNRPFTNTPAIFISKSFLILKSVCQNIESTLRFIFPATFANNQK